MGQKQEDVFPVLFQALAEDTEQLPALLALNTGFLSYEFIEPSSEFFLFFLCGIPGFPQVYRLPEL